jgi:hypothetical protein
MPQIEKRWPSLLLSESFNGQTQALIQWNRCNGKKFAPYSQSYAESQDFKIAGKSKNEVNLQLSGDTIKSMQILQNNPGYVTIGFNDGTPENDKAAWAQADDNGPQRRFLSLSDKELEQIIAEVKVNRPTSLKSLAKEEQRPKAVKSITDSFIKNLLKQLK